MPDAKILSASFFSFITLLGKSFHLSMFKLNEFSVARNKIFSTTYLQN